MPSHEPFLVLISPSVADVGHAYVIADSVNQPSSGFSNLQEQCDNLQILAQRNDPAACLAVVRHVTQWSTSQRDASEWLACSALPKNAGLSGKVKSVLQELWSQVYDVNDETSATWLKKATPKQGSLFQAARMTEITRAFRSHPEITGIAWSPVPLCHPESGHLTPKPRSYMKILLILGLIVGLPAATIIMISGTANDPHPGVPAAVTPTQSLNNWNQWNEVLLSDDRWKTLLEQTGGKEAFQEWASERKDATAESGHGRAPKSILDRVFPSKPNEPKEPDARGIQRQQETVNKLQSWSKLFSEEFDIADASAGAVNRAPMTKYLMQAKPPWHRNIDNQISQQGRDLLFLARVGTELEEFTAILGKSTSLETPRQLRTAWSALDTYSKSSPSDGLKPFHDVVKRELAKSSDRPNDFEILTLKDAERVRLLKTIFGSAEFGLLTGRSFSEKEDRWPIIKEFLDRAIRGLDEMSGPERALMTTLKSLFDPANTEKGTLNKLPRLLMEKRIVYSNFPNK